MTVYIVLGILYENYIHPITILSTLPSAGVGALLALILFKTQLTVIALIGIILLIGIVKKNAILMIDFAIQAERNEDNSPEESIYQACLLRFRPIMMTTMAAMFGGHPDCHFQRKRSGIAAPLGHRHRRRATREPDAYAVHDSGDLPCTWTGFASGSAEERCMPSTSFRPRFRQHTSGPICDLIGLTREPE